MSTSTHTLVGLQVVRIIPSFMDDPNCFKAFDYNKCALKTISGFSHRYYSFIHSFIHSGHLYSASSVPPLLRGAPDTAWILCRSFTPKRHRQLRVKDLPKVHTWRLDSNPTPFGR